MKALRPAVVTAVLLAATLTAAAADPAPSAGWRACLPDDWLLLVVSNNPVGAEAAIAESIGVDTSVADYQSAAERVMTALGVADAALADREIAVGLAKSAAGESYPFALLPADDAEALAESMGGEMTGDLAVVTVSDVEMILAPCGDWTLLTGFEQIEEAQAVQQRGAIDKAAPASDEPLYLALEFSPEGIAHYHERASQVSRRDRSFALRNMLRWPPTPRALEAAVALNRPLMDFASRRVNGVRIQATPRDAGGVTLRLTAPLKTPPPSTESPGGAVQFPQAIVDSAVSRLTGDGQSGLSQTLTRAMLAYSEGRPDEIDAKRYDAEAFAAYRTTVERAMAHVIAFDALRRSRHAGDDALEANHAVLVSVDDPAAFETAIEEMFVAWNRLVQSSKAKMDISFQPSREATLGREFLTFGVDMATAIRVGAAPEIRQLMQRLFGEGGRYSWRLTRVGGGRMLLTDTPADEAAELASIIESTPAGEGEAAPGAWRASLPLDRYFAWRSVVRKVSEGKVVGRPPPPEMPEQTIHASAAIKSGALEVEFTAPAEAAQAVGKFWLRIR